jgi:hypothetical protein
VAILYDGPLIDQTTKISYRYNWTFAQVPKEESEEAAGEGGRFAAAAAFTNAQYALAAGAFVESAEAGVPPASSVGSQTASGGKKRRNSDSGAHLNPSRIRPTGVTDLRTGSPAGDPDAIRMFDPEGEVFGWQPPMVREAALQHTMLSSTLLSHGYAGGPPTCSSQ